ncbi:sigma-B regulation protein RsbU (phosphoserine phosphatase) [Paenibacillus endophyticus]|uniref:Sigma-B regulation protein RsbU (Phosphoserine phosphatase) n=1 Tax=Paenibacillus endophyticus TaxID=1294268 RepID=A0A7W5C5D4_9BACL|nr:fused response regulator/phosphatase [Paenibacillus endophyticus]MBB3151004.1 sigma-B regulation protein RsbU (phosphoserine phosphatase) [Paenibacillus endophyticus]
MSIIIVDDNTTNQIIIKAILNKEGYQDLKIASSAMELYDMLDIDNACTAETNVDLILMDMMMPEIDGLEACKRILQVERYKDVPIIFVTALGDSNKMAEALDAGASDYVMKPINKMELLARIRSSLRLKREIDWHKERDMQMKTKLELAKKVQRNVLSQPINDDQITVSAVYQPSSELAGDFYAWYRIDQSRYGVILLDMMGHGISSSLVCMYISSVLKDTIMRITEPDLVMHELNRYMNQLYKKEELLNYYFTAIYMVIDTDKKIIEYVNAGHPPGKVLTGGDELLLTEGCCAIGLFENIDIRKGTFAYEGQMKLFLYTDGLSEALGDNEEVKLHLLVERLRGEEVCEHTAIVSDFLSEFNNESQKDDICVVMITTKER